MRLNTRSADVLYRQLALPIAIFFTTSLVASAQSIPSGRAIEPSQLPRLTHSDEWRDPGPPSLLTPLEPKTLEDRYHPITPRQSLRWFITSTIGPPHLAGEVFQSACGTAVDRPKEYGPHWDGAAARFGVGMAGSATGNAIEAGAGLILHEDPRYFRVPDQTFPSRAGNVMRLTFVARGDDGRFVPAYARYIAIVGSNFISNTWRVPSEANAQQALVRASEGFAGRMGANAFDEFWPDVKRHIFHKRN